AGARGAVERPGVRHRVADRRSVHVRARRRLSGLRAVKVVVTGASGFIGRHSLPALVARGHEVHAMARRALQLPRLPAHVCDLLDPHATAALIARVRPTHLLHFAWYAVPGKYWTAPENLDWVAATLHLLRGFAASGGQRVVMAGTCAEYDWSHPTLSE